MAIRPIGRAFHQACYRASKIHFAVDDIRSIPDAVRLGKRGFFTNDPIMGDNMTNAELHYVLTNRAAYDKAIFYRGGKQIDKLPFMGP